MNVTLKLPDELVREARHLAVDENKSLSALVADILRRALSATSVVEEKKPKTWIDAFSGDDDGFLDRDFPLEDRKSIPNREFHFRAY